MFFRDVRRQRILNAIHEDCKISIECESGRDDDDISAEIESSMEICKTVSILKLNMIIIPLNVEKGQ